MTDDRRPDDAAESPPERDTDVPEPAEPVESVEPVRPAGRGGRTVRLGAMVLTLFGLLALVLAGYSALNPEQGVCSAAVNELEDADDPPMDPDDVDCGDEDDRTAAIAAAEELNGDDDLPSESTYRTSGFIGAGVGIALAVGSVLTVVTRSKAWRLVALISAAVSVVFLFALLFPIGIALLLYGVYAILFSADARSIFGEPGGPRLLRPRT